MSRLAYLPAMILAFGLVAGSTAEAGFPWLRSQPPQPVYAPQMNRYAVIAPNPIATRHGVYGDQTLWAEQRPSTPVYPWGWFGTHNSPQGWTHTGYYGEYSDHGIIREQ